MEQKAKKAAIVAEYLRGGISYRQLHGKYGFALGAMHAWVQQYLETMDDETTIRQKIDSLVDEDLGLAMPSDIKTLQAELRKSRLHNKLLEEMITIAEEELSAPIRKKHGTRQS
jgi:transposase-like protein